MFSLPDLPGYRIERELGRGGMAAVYLATQVSLQRPVALKLLQPTAQADPQLAERFLREARALAELHHPNVVTVHDVVESAAGPFIAMELLAGGSLAERIRGERLSLPQTLAIIAPLATALAAAHAHGIVHRDVKPENILFRDAVTPVLVDFGIAQRHRLESQATERGVLLGTPTYMAPEQIEGHAVDGRSDLYSLGVVFYEMLCGLPPFCEGSTQDVLMAHLARPAPPLPSRLNALQPVLDRMLAKRPEQRYHGMFEMLADLGERLVERPELLGASEGGSRTERLRALGFPADLAAQHHRSTTRRLFRADSQTTLGAQRLRRPALLLSATLLVGIASLWAWRPWSTSSAAADSLAVLPFRNLSSDPEHGFLAEGLAEELSARLVRLPDWRVISRGASARLQNPDDDAREVGRQLGVGRLLRGSLRVAGSRLRVTVQLLDTVDGRQLWAQTFERPRDQWFAIEDAVAAAVLQQLEGGSAKPAESASERPTASIAAYEHYLRSRHIARSGQVDAHERELAELRAALALDPEFILAHAQTARALLVRYHRGAASREEALAQAQPHIDAALGGRQDEVQPLLAQAHFLQIQGNYAAAETALREALRLAPNEPTVLGNLDYLLWEIGGREAEERPLLERAVLIDPLSPTHSYNLAELYVQLGEYQLADRQYRRTIAIAGDAAFGYTGLARFHWLVSGDLTAAMTSFAEAHRRDPRSSRTLAFPAMLLIEQGELAGAAAWLGQADRDTPEDAHRLRARALWELHSSRADTAWATLQSALARGERGLAVAAGQLGLLLGHRIEAGEHFRTALGDASRWPAPSRRNLRALIGHAAVQLQSSEAEAAQASLQQSLSFVRGLPLRGGDGALLAEAEILALLGQHDAALDRLLELQAAGVRPSLLADVWNGELNPYLAPLHADPRFQRWLQAEREQQQRQRLALRDWHDPAAALARMANEPASSPKL